MLYFHESLGCVQKAVLHSERFAGLEMKALKEAGWDVESKKRKHGKSLRWVSVCRKQKKLVQSA